MPFTYHPPTRTSCETCKDFSGELKPIISTKNGKASSADNFPFHNWFNFVLGYSPEFPNYVIKREGVDNRHFVVDPFMGSGTTLVCCKENKIKSAGIDANDFFQFAAETKLNWDVDIPKIRLARENLLSRIAACFNDFAWPADSGQSLFLNKKKRGDFKKYARENRPEMLPDKYISDAPFSKIHIIKKEICGFPRKKNSVAEKLFLLALAKITLPSSNVRYGPGFGIIPPREDADVLTLFRKQTDTMISDLSSISQNTRKTQSRTYLGDARELSKILEPKSVDFMITSPPYPGDHEYTKHSKLELILLDHADDINKFRVIKKRMLRGSTTNIYKEDEEGELIKDIKSIQKITNEIDKRLKKDGATSGFEKLYTKLIWEYFGGMYKVFLEAHKVLRPGGKFMLLVSDSHAFKMVHIETAKLLGEVAKKAGFKKSHIELWQYKISTSHKYKLLENILTVQK